MFTKSNLVKPEAKKMCSREILARKLHNIVSTDKQSIEKIGQYSWKFKNVDVDSKVNDYVIKLVESVGKSGKTFKKRELYRVIDGKECKVELGEYKKTYLYKIINSLVNTKKRHKLMNTNISDIIKMGNYIYSHKSDFQLNGNILTGNTPQGTIKADFGFVKHMKNNHNRVFGRKLYINGELFFEGGWIDYIHSAFTREKFRPRKEM